MTYEEMEMILESEIKHQALLDRFAGALAGAVLLVMAITLYIGI